MSAPRRAPGPARARPGEPGPRSPAADAAARIADWFAGAARDLPWRRAGAEGRRDAYGALVSEFMLQQTQVSRVLEKFGPFLARFPTPAALAAAPEQEVLAAWSGLGYYRRARLLHAAAKAIVERHGGIVPGSRAALEDLPGIGRYTAGAVASIVFGEPEAIVDGNIARVLQRVHGKDGAADEPTVRAWCWQRAEEMARALPGRAGAVNEGMMELGAVVCTPRAPRCGACPLADLCVARLENRQDRVPAPKTRAERRPLYCASARVSDAQGRLWVEQRGERGLWAGMWQAPTLERDDRMPRVSELAARLGLDRGVLRARERLVHGTTHRDVRFAVFAAEVDRPPPAGIEAVDPARAGELAMGNVQRRILLGGTVSA